MLALQGQIRRGEKRNAVRENGAPRGHPYADTPYLAFTVQPEYTLISL
jgi:hypothetical protein